MEEVGWKRVRRAGYGSPILLAHPACQFYRPIPVPYLRPTLSLSCVADAHSCRISRNVISVYL